MPCTISHFIFDFYPHFFHSSKPLHWRPFSPPSSARNSSAPAASANQNRANQNGPALGPLGPRQAGGKPELRCSDTECFIRLPLGQLAWCCRAWPRRGEQIEQTQSFTHAQMRACLWREKEVSLGLVCGKSESKLIARRCLLWANLSFNSIESRRSLSLSLCPISTKSASEKQSRGGKENGRAEGERAGSK